ncbi:cytidine deaminase [Marinirhabdus gelatinilytica]|uniref:Cytidine deaminase n=1 Tax=Marinirhabdus gelatinilytica TaxID=1703343 RepID=A0A370Q7F8_9FLAO|nr:cytidine deaminase [Marinirhabdus gelatinilytica]RDK84291.1 cytidine deaminase [Marinirhabdus gelatinilytica]
MAKKLTITTQLTVFQSIDELPQPIQELMHKAQEARERAYAPYSLFKVGAALQLANGEVVMGNNQENAAFPSGLCAERVAAFHAGATYPGVAFQAMALTVRSLQKEVNTPTPPCGACRQSLAEYEVNQKTPIAIYFMGETGKVAQASSVKDLLPFVFDSTFLQNIS